MGRVRPLRTAAGCAALLVVCLATSAVAVGLPPELEYAKGVVAYSRGQLDQAAGHFQAVLDAQPDNTQAMYYLAQVSLAAGQVPQAIALFTRVVELTPADPGVRLDLALALVKASRYADAEQQLLAAAPALGDRASLHYYLGYCRYQLGRFRRALGPLQRAVELDGGFAASAGYYLGLVHYRLGQQAEAARQFQQLAGADRSGRFGALARQNLAEMAGQGGEEQARWWGLYASIGGGYDSNVTLEVEGSTANAGADSPSAFFSVGAFLVPLRLEQDSLELSASLFRSFYFSGDTPGFDLTDAAAVVRYRHTFDAGHRLELAYLFDLDMLDDLSMAGGPDEGFGTFMQGHALQARLVLHEGRRTATSLEYRFHWQGFAVSDRNNFGHTALLRQEFRLASGLVRLGLQAGGLFEDAPHPDWNLWGALAGIDLRAKIVGPLSGWVQAGWLREDHFTFSIGTRVDDRWTAGAGLSVALWDHLSIGVDYRTIYNRSTGPFDYHKHAVGLSVMGWY